MPLSPSELSDVFDEVMRCPESSRGMDVQETSRLLAERAKRMVPPEEYADTMRALEQVYLDGFVNTCARIPDFATRIRRSITLYL